MNEEELFQFEIVALSSADYYVEKIRSLGVPVHILEISANLRSFKNIYLLAKLIVRIRPELVNTWMYHADLVGGVLAKIIRIPCVIWSIRQSNTEYSKYNKLTYFIIKLNSILSYIVPNKIICCSSLTASKHVSIGYDRSKMIVINNGVDTNLYKPSDEAKNNLRKKLGIKNNKYIVGHVARYDPLKGHKLMLECIQHVLNHYKNVIFLLYGMQIDSMNSELTQLIEDLGIHEDVMLLGHSDRLYDIYPAMDLLCLTSISEGFPNVLIEAMACGVPCISTNVSAADEIVGDTGFVVHDKLPENISARIIEYFNNETNIKKEYMKKARQRIIENYSLQKMKQQYSDAYLGQIDN
jgi:glycosyltransferase involved in cell wall biosynthesis